MSTCLVSRMEGYPWSYDHEKPSIRGDSRGCYHHVFLLIHTYLLVGDRMSKDFFVSVDLRLLNAHCFGDVIA